MTVETQPLYLYKHEDRLTAALYSGRIKPGRRVRIEVRIPVKLTIVLRNKHDANHDHSTFWKIKA